MVKGIADIYILIAVILISITMIVAGAYYENKIWGKFLFAAGTVIWFSCGVLVILGEASAVV
jgi:hypothetical protein